MEKKLRKHEEKRETVTTTNKEIEENRRKRDWSEVRNDQEV